MEKGTDIAAGRSGNQIVTGGDRKAKNRRLHPKERGNRVKEVELRTTNSYLLSREVIAKEVLFRTNGLTISAGSTSILTISVAFLTTFTELG